MVQTDAGPVIVASLDALRARSAQLQGWASTASVTSKSLREQAAEHYAASGAILVPRSAEWSVPPSLAPLVEHAKALVAQINEQDRTAGDLKEQQAEGNVFHRIGAWHHGQDVKQTRAQEAADLRSLLIEIAKAAPGPTVSEADVEIQAASKLDGQATALDGQVASALSSVARYKEEVASREDAIKAMGFDSLLEAAILQTSGPQPVESPLVLKAGEAAYVSVPATLARVMAKTHYVGGSSGFSFPIGHTGIRYRVGSFRGQPVQQQAFTKLDTGTFVLSNQRVAFIGRTRSTAIPLGKIMHVEVYSDALAVFIEGRENPDFYLVSQPKYVVFLLNWFLAKKA